MSDLSHYMDAMVTNIGGNEIYEKHPVQMKGFLVNVVIDFFLFNIKISPENIQLSVSRRMARKRHLTSLSRKR